MWLQMTRRSVVHLTGVLLISGVLLAIACRPAPEATIEALAGFYVGEGAWSIEVLELRPDGTYVERWMSFAGPVTTSSGHWVVRADAGGHGVEIDLDDAYLGNPFREPKPMAGPTTIRVRHRYLGIERYLTEGPDESIILTFRGRQSPGGDQPVAEADSGTSARTFDPAATSPASDPAP